MLGRYRLLFATPGAARFSAAGFVMRLPISMMGLGSVLLVAGSTGSYGVAGAVAATISLVQAVTAAPLGRLVDRRGQARVIVPAVAAHSAGLAGLLLLTAGGAATWTLFPVAALYGAAYPPAGSLVRARWAHAVAGTALLPTAYSVESILDEVIFIVGPVLVTVLATQLAPAAGLLAALVFAVLGTIALAVQRRTEPPAGPAGSGPHPSALAVPGIRVLVVVAVAFGGIFGSIEVVAVAFTAERGRPGTAGLVLALLAAGSMLSGVLYGAVSWRAPLRQRFLAGAGALAVAIGALPLAGTIPLLAVLGFVGGFTISPTLIATFGLVDELAPAGALTEALSWLSTGIGVGLAVASSVAGQLIDAVGARTAFCVPVVSALGAVGLGLAGARWLGPPAGAARPAATADG